MYGLYEYSSEDGILQQLKVIFPSMPHWRLREVGKANNYHLDSCIDQLTNIVISDVKDMPHQQSHPNRGQDEERIGSLIKKGYRIMILMRGPPGVGKSYIARYLVNNFVNLDNNKYSTEDFICSTDDYFYNDKGVYKYNSSLLSEAHEFNHQRVRDKANSGLSPIIVDNTNMQLWEMLPYVKFAVQNNYIIEILEPNTPWRNSPSSLAEKNKHGVPKNRIQQMMEKYEKGTVASLTRMLKNTKYTKTLPQMRSLPPLDTTSRPYETMRTHDDIIRKGELLEPVERHDDNAAKTSESKEQRAKFKISRSLRKSYDQQDCSASSTRNVYNLLEKKTTNVWKPIESESTEFWGVKSPEEQEQRFSKFDSCEKTIFELLKEDEGDIQYELKTSRQDESAEKKGLISFERHSTNCPNENNAFISLRQIYPNKRLSGLWDLFVKCNGDVDWAIDILLKEDELKRIRCDEDVIYQPEDDEPFQCLCNNMNKETISQHKSNVEDIIHNSTTSEDNIKYMLSPTYAKPQRQRPRFSRSNQRTNPALQEVKQNIENCFVLGDELYSEHLQKIRNNRSGISELISSSNAMAYSCENMENQFLKNEDNDENIESEDDDVDVDVDNESDDSSEDMLEISLGEQLIQQLVDTFRNESSIEEQIYSALPVNTKIFMPRSLAKQLYMLWVETGYNHMEEERQKLLKEDEDFARLLKNPKFSELKQSPNNVQEILDMEYAWKIYNQDKEEQQHRDEMEKLHAPKNLATHLTQMKLCETFPDIPRETLLDMLVANDNDYSKTISVLRSTTEVENVSTTKEHLMECAQREQDLVNQQVQNQIHQRQERIDSNWGENDQKSSLSSDEAKRLALREFEESRNLAAHHCQLKAECYQKAKEAIQSENGGAAIYYSEIANLHIKKIDMYNHRAANCIMDVHRNTQNNPDLLDLHYLYLIEALGCLDLFLDRHITGLRLASRNYKHVFIITGRGKHSAGGVSTIKNKVKARLKERCLRWSEVNPGLLKVKIFSGSRHSKNI